MRRLLLKLGVVFCAATCSAQQLKPTTNVPLWKQLKYAPLKPLTMPQVEDIRLSNGMRVLLLENHELPQISGFGLVRTGNLFDPPDRIGLASVTGAAIRSGGTESKTSDHIDEELENIAASVETGIGETSGSVSFSCLKENTDEVMGVFKDVITHPAFREDKIDLIKRQLMSAISRRNDEPQEIAQREFTDILYGRKSPYGWDMEYATVMNIKRPDVVAFYKRYFFPENIILAVYGDFKSADMKVQLEKLFADWTVKQPPVPPFPRVKFDYQPGVYLGVKDDVAQTTFYMGQPGGMLNNPDRAALDVMADILGGGFRGRLFKRLRTQLGYVYGVYANWGANFDHPGLFSISGSTRSATTVKTIAAAREEVDKIRREPVTEEELESAKESVLNSFVFAFDTPAKTVRRLLNYYYFGYPTDFIFQYQKAIKALNIDDISRVAKQYLDPSKFIVVAVGNPKEFDEPLDKLGMPVTKLDLTIPPPPGAPSPASKGAAH
jgi:zinc protease